MKPILLRKEGMTKQSTISEQIIDNFMFNDSEYVIIKKLKSNFGEIWGKFCLKLSELREVYSKKLIVEIKMSKSEKYW